MKLSARILPFIVLASSASMYPRLVSSATTPAAGSAKRNNKATKKKRSTKAPSSIKKHKGSKGSSLKHTTIHLSPGQSIQEALDNASENTVIHLNPGDYTEPDNVLYGLRVTKNNIKLIAPGTGTTRILKDGKQEVGIYAAPEGCEYNANVCSDTLQNFSIQGIVVEGFPKNGIQTRWVDGFKFIDCQSINNLRNGLYPTISMNGIIQGCTSSGSLDAAIWVAGSVQVKVVDNDIHDSITGFEVTVSKDVQVMNNSIYNNVVGIGMYHANMAGTEPDYPSFDNWVFQDNIIYNNNRQNDSPAGSFQSFLPSGLGILMVGVRGQTVRNNLVEGNNLAGILMAGLCTVQAVAFGQDCEGANAPRDGDPSANDNVISGNSFGQNGLQPNINLGLPGKDILYAQLQSEFLKPNNNCFQDNISSSEDGGVASNFATEDLTSEIPLPTGGC
jgi:hypothetical protein